MRAGFAGRALVPAGGLLAVHAHPDDETLSTGALLATWAAAGLPVTVVTCTRGERGEVIALPGTTSEGLAGLEGDGPALAAHREGELAAALRALGRGDAVAIEQVFLDQVAVSEPELAGATRGSDTRYEDSGMVWVASGVAGPDPAVSNGFARSPLDDAAARVAAVVRARRPAVVVTYEPGGGYGHPDHVRARAVTARALELAADPGASVAGEPWTPELWEAVAPASELRAARRALGVDPMARTLVANAHLALPDPDEPLPSVARDENELAGRDVVRVAVEPVLGQVLGAMRAHATQVQHATGTTTSPTVLGWYALSNGVLAPILDTEVYAVVRDAVEPPVGSAR